MQLVHVGVARAAAGLVLRGEVVDDVAPHPVGRADWAANILAEDGEQVCRLFAQKGADRFAKIAYGTARSGAPILDDAIAFVDCETVAEHDAGDHVIVVGNVLELGYAPEGKPLLFYRGGYGRFEV